MKEFDNLKELWQQQKESTLPDVTVIIDKAKKAKKQMANKIIIQVMVLLLTTVAIGGIVCGIDFKMATTFTGVALMLFTILAYSALRLYQLNMLKKIDLTLSPKVVLSEMEHFYSFQQKVSTKYTLLYFVLLSIASGLYFIEVMQPMSVMFKTVGLTVFIAWMLIAYFIIGKKQMRKEYDKTESIINALKEIEKNYEQ